MNLNRMMQKPLILARWTIGILFIFSGFVKGIDPAGLQYKLYDYIDAIHLQTLNFSVPFGSIFLPFAEFLIGITLLTGIFIRLSTRLAFAFMLFFTPLTLFIALKNPVTDCGCFGDALVISNWQTFYKNIVLILIAISLVINTKNLQFITEKRIRLTAFTLFLLLYISAVYWSYNHEPIVDFRPYKIGTNIPEGMSIPDGAPTDIYQNNYYYRNRKSNQVIKFGEKDFPWKDTINWKFESMDPPLLIKKGYSPPIHDFSIQNADQQNVTDYFLRDSLFTFFVIAYDLEKSSHVNEYKLNTLAKWAMQKGYHFIGLTSTTGAALNKFKLEQKPLYEMMFTDQIPLKTMIRSNPGLILLRKGTILAKWGFNDFPSTEKIEAIIHAEMNKKLNR